MDRELIKTASILAILLFLSGSISITTAASPPLQTNPLAQVYIIQAEDTLPHLADKYYRDPDLWPAIWQATLAAAENDTVTTAIDNPYVIKPGQRLIVPTRTEAETLQAEAFIQESLPFIIASSDVQPITAAWLAEFSAYVEETRQHFGIPGVALAIVRDNQTVLAQGFGVRQLGQAGPITPETIFGIGSTTKAMNALLVATLVEDQFLDWDQPVVEIWPDFALSDPAVTPTIRVRDLLNMSSGVPRADLAWSGVGLSAEEMMASLTDLPVVAPRGQRFQYNNQTVATGGYLAALAAGGDFGQLDQVYARLLRERVFEPIGLQSASLSIEMAQSHPNHAMPHDFTLAGKILPTYYHTDSGVAPAGAVNANILDMARFLLTELNYGTAPNGNQVVSSPYLVETWRPQVFISPDTSYGMGWFIETYQGIEMIWHEGDVLGFKSLLVFVPEARVGLTLLTNRTISIGFSSSIRYRLIEMLYKLDIEAGSRYKEQWDNFIEALPQILEPLDLTPAPDEVAPYLGHYNNGWQVELRDDGTLWTIRGPYEWQLLAAGEGNFIVNNGFGITSEIQFVTDESEAITMIVKLSTGEIDEYTHLEP